MTKLVRMAVLVAAAAFAGVGMTGCAADANTRSTAQTFDDGTLTAKVKTALLADEGLKGNQVKVETYRGVVQLSGFVDSADQAQRAVAAAQGVEGVWLFPTLGVLYEERLKRDVEAVCATFEGFNRWVEEWSLPTEPFTFLVGADGVIRDRFEGLVTVGELTGAVHDSLLD